MAAALLVLAGCDGTASDEGAGPPTPGPVSSSASGGAPPTTPSTTPPTVAPTAPPVPDEVVIAVAGDVHFEGALRDRLAEPATALAPATRALAAADVAVVNLETSVGDGGRPEPGKRFTFQAPASALSALAAAGIDVATMANNHALDYGRAGLPELFAALGTIRGADPPLDVVGIGRDARAAFRPARVDVDGVVVATIGATLAATDPTADPTGQWAATTDSAGTADAVDPARLLRSVERADADADVVLVYLHWGIQGEACPTARQRALARTLVDHGADVVVGSHQHRLQGDGRLGEGYVAYGLGNYAWYTPSPSTAADTGVLTLTVRPAATPAHRASVVRAVWEPARIGTDGLPQPVNDQARADFRTQLQALRGCAGLLSGVRGRG